jgi:hypothetical protein
VLELGLAAIHVIGVSGTGMEPAGEEGDGDDSVGGGAMEQHEDLWVGCGALCADRRVAVGRLDRATIHQGTRVGGGSPWHPTRILGYTWHMTARRTATWVLAIAGGYLAVLLIGGLAAGSCVRGRLQARLGAALGAQVAVGDCSVSLVRGRISLRDVAIDTEPGQASSRVRIRIDRVEVGTAPLGWMIVDREARDVLIEGARFELSAAGAAALRELRGEPVQARQLRLAQVHLQIAPTALLPWLGRVDIDIASARTRPLALRSALGWIPAVEALEARVDAPGATATVGYRDRTLRVTSSLLGPLPVVVPFELAPDAAAVSDASGASGSADEIAALRSLALRLVQALGKQKVKQWLDDHVLAPMRDAAQ